MVMGFVIPSAKLIRYRLRRPGLECFTQFDRMRHRLVQLVLVKFAFRTADDDAGDTIADIAMLGWVRNLIGFYGARELVEFDRLTRVPAWLERGLARPAVQRGLDIPKRP